MFTSDLASQRNDKVPEAQNLKLYPKQPKKTMTKTAIGDKNIADNFLHPKMHYKPIARTHDKRNRKSKNKK
ncbi:unnamed protein product [Lasius platythorax]|uniref:Uncharacterized protein n=1 Tax=Lasius platythorax TaxID=488582 RepID=A0AAV2NFM8_9HYME